MTQKEKKESFIELGHFLSQFSPHEIKQKENVPGNEIFFNDFKQLIENLQHYNGWFTPDQVLFATTSWSKALTAEKLSEWLAAYTFQETTPKTIGLILAGNIPLVGFHDFLTVLISGHRVLVKTSSNDQKLLPFLAQYLIHLDPRWKEYISFTEGKLEGFDAVIATGSNNTARYFEYYFKNSPNIIRKNRNSVAVLDGNESYNDLVNLGEDIFRYYGLGCRNVSKLFVPEGYDFKMFFEAIYQYKDIINYEKYANNYDYNKAVYLMSNFKLLDNGFITLKEDISYSSPISSVFYTSYSSLSELKKQLSGDNHLIQCIVSNQLIEKSTPFGKTQQPELWDYADNIDTISFLLELDK